MSRDRCPSCRLRLDMSFYGACPECGSSFFDMSAPPVGSPEPGGPAGRVTRTTRPEHGSPTGEVGPVSGGRVLSWMMAVFMWGIVWLFLSGALTAASTAAVEVFYPCWDYPTTPIEVGLDAPEDASAIDLARWSEARCTTDRGSGVLTLAVVGSVLIVAPFLATQLARGWLRRRHRSPVRV